MLVTIHQPEHLPWLGLLAKVAVADLWVVLDDVAYRKNYFQNRNRIMLAGEPAWVTVPVSAPHGTAIADVTIAEAPSWQRKYSGRLLQAYEQAPFPDAGSPAVELVARAGTGSSLSELNLALFAWLAEAFGVHTPIVCSSALGLPGAKSELLRDICREVGATSYLAGPSGRDYLDRSLFDSAGIQVRFFDFHHPSYPQQTPEFMPGMSAVDALANVGLQAAKSLLSDSSDLAEA